MVKRDALQCHDTATVGTGEERTSLPQKILQKDLEEWRAIWCRLEGSQEAPWRGHTGDGQAVPPITAAQVAIAARSFKSETRIGSDKFPPFAIAFLSLDLRSCIAQFLNFSRRKECGRKVCPLP